MKLPKVTFDNWSPWADRDRLACRGSPGVYLLAFDMSPNEDVLVTDERIIYIGQTCASLQQRWRQFQRAASGAEGGHSGGESFRERCNGRSLAELYLAPWAPPMNPGALRDAYIKFVERQLILDWVIEHDRLPRCNTSRGLWYLVWRNPAGPRVAVRSA